MRLSTLLAKLKPSKKRLWLLLPIFLLAAGAYILVTTLAPTLPPTPAPQQVVEEFLATEPEIKENRLYIPQINVDVAIVEGNSPAALEKGAWHRKPQRGDPERGGNFIISAHRFQLGLTPQQTKARSPFYHIDKLNVGDKIYADFNQKRYTYEITKKYKVNRNAMEIEAPSVEVKLTLYSCDLRGEAAGREVIEAKPLL
jgi:LPXTG-site transpeptidase (sortase) family protein